MRRILHGVGHGRLLLPIILMIAGYFIPVLHTPVGDPMPGELWMWISISLVVLIPWFLTEYLVLTSRNTSISALQLDSVCGAWLAIFLSMVFGFYVGCMIVGIAQYPLPWWIIVPWTGCAIDATVSTLLTINNAAQKPFSPPDRNNQ